MEAENAIYIAVAVITSAFVFNIGAILACRAFGVGMDKIAVLLDPWFSIFKIKVKDTLLILGWVPFGGYVKVRGVEGKYYFSDGLMTKPRWAQVLVAGSGTFMLIGFILICAHIIAPSLGGGLTLIGQTIKAFFQLGVFQLFFSEFSDIWRSNMEQANSRLFFMLAIVASLNAISTLLNFSITFRSKFFQKILPFLFPLLTVFYILIVLRIVFNTSILYLGYYILTSIGVAIIYLGLTYIFFQLIRQVVAEEVHIIESKKKKKVGR